MPDLSELKELGSTISIAISNAAATARTAASTALSQLGDAIGVKIQGAVDTATTFATTAFTGLQMQTHGAIQGVVDAAMALKYQIGLVAVQQRLESGQWMPLNLVPKAYPSCHRQVLAVRRGATSLALIRPWRAGPR